MLPENRPSGKRQRRPRNPPGTIRRFECEYVYHDERGRAVFRKKKYGHYNPAGIRVGKDCFVESKPYPDTYPHLSVPHLDDKYKGLLFRLPSLLDALYFGHDVYWCEGEADVTAAESVYGAYDRNIQTVAFTSHHDGNALASRGAIRRIAKYFTPRAPGGAVSCSRIRLVMDRDETGAYIAWEHGQRLLQAGVPAAQVYLVRPEVRRRGADLEDHLSAGLGLEDLHALSRSEMLRVRDIARKWKADMRSRGLEGMGEFGSESWMIDGYAAGGFSSREWGRKLRREGC